MKVNEATVVGIDDGPCYDWRNDSIKVHIDSDASGGAFTLVEDRLKPGFKLGLHRHETHAETFYILDGSVVFRIGDERVRACAGMSVHVPAGVPHGAETESGTAAQMLMFYTPGGFERYLAAVAALPPHQASDPAILGALDGQYDIHSLE